MTKDRLNRRAFSASLFGMAAVFSTQIRARAMPFDRDRLGDSPVRVTRGFGNGLDGMQLHYRRAEPIDKTKLKSQTPVLCLHQTPNSSQVFVEFISELARDRIVYAVDTPGLGESDSFAEPPEIADYARSMLAFLENEKLGPVDIVGYHTGASIALEIAALQSDQIKSMMLVGLALFNEEERAGFFNSPWPRPIEADGSHLQHEWNSTHKWRGPGQTDASVRRAFLTKISAGERGWWGARAVMRHDIESRLKQATSPLLVINPNDDLFEITPKALAIRPCVKIIDYPDHGFGIFEVIPSEIASLARNHFDGK